MCRARFELPKSGKKQDLIDRLIQHPSGGFDGGGGAGAGARSDDGGGGSAEGGGAVHRDSSGRLLCPHNRRKHLCKECGGSGLCEAWPKEEQVHRLRWKRDLRAWP
jgi:hypothetical protein